MMPYGTRIAVRRSPRRDLMARCITRASANPRISSTTTVTTVMKMVTPMACQKSGSVRTTS